MPRGCAPRELPSWQELCTRGCRVSTGSYRDSLPPESRTTGSMPALLLSDTELPRLVASPAAPETKRGRRIALSILLIGSFIVVAWIASPLWVGIALGTVMAFTTQPIYRKVSARLHRRRHLAAGIVTLGSGLLCAAIGVLVLYIVATELLSLVSLLQAKSAGDSLADLIGTRGVHVVERLGLNPASVNARIRHEMGTATSYAAAGAGVILQETSSAVLGLIVGTLTMYYVLLEWPRLAVRLERVLPLDPRHTRALILEFRDVGRGALVGAVATAAVQGALGGLGYAVAGSSQAITWAVFTAIASFLPVVGTGTVWAPIGIDLISKGRLTAGIFVLVWGFCVVMTLTDYVIRPRLVGRKGHGHPLLMLIALLGGIEVFGLPGLIVAPILMSLFLAVLRIYERESRKEANPLTEDRTMNVR